MAGGRDLRQQLEAARSVQLGLLPSADSIPKGIDLTGVCLPAWQVGGDFYDVSTDDEGRTGVMLADVAGKGLPASLLSSLIQGALRATSWTADALHHEEATRELNNFLCARSASERFASLFWCYYDRSRSSLRYINAGHLAPMLVGKGPRGSFDVRRLDEGGPVLGLLPGCRYHQGEARLAPSDLLVMFSDGITEAENAKGEEYGEDRLMETLCENWARSPGQICDSVFTKIRSFLGNVHAQDDQTLVIVRLRQVNPGNRLGGACSPVPVTPGLTAVHREAGA